MIIEQKREKHEPDPPIYEINGEKLRSEHVGTSDVWKQTGIRTIVIEEIRHLAERHGLETVILFGSRARGDFRRASDIDLAVSGEEVDLFRLDVEEDNPYIAAIRFCQSGSQPPGGSQRED